MEISLIFIVHIIFATASFLSFFCCIPAASSAQLGGYPNEDNFGEFSADITTLNLGMLSVAIWGGLMTIAVAVLAIVVYRRWRRNQYNSDGQSVAGSQASSDLSDFSSRMGSVLGIDELGTANEAYTIEDEQPPDNVPEVTVTDPTSLPTVHQSQNDAAIVSSSSVSIRL